MNPAIASALTGGQLVSDPSPLQENIMTTCENNRRGIDRRGDEAVRAAIEATHTPGPWRHGRSGSFAGYVICNDPPSLGTASVEVASTRGLDTEANARLIAAAPDLLEACQMVMDTVGRVMTTTQHDLIRAAIAKATT